MVSTPEQETSTTTWTIRLKEWRATGQSQKAYCEAHDLGYHQFSYWRRKLEGGGRQRGKATVSNSGFVPVTKSGDSSMGGLTISLPNGIQIKGVGAQHVDLMKSLVDSLV